MFDCVFFLKGICYGIVFIVEKVVFDKLFCIYYFNFFILDNIVDFFLFKFGDIYYFYGIIDIDKGLL